MQTHLKSGQAKKTLKKDKRSHGQEAKVLKCLIMNIVSIFRRTHSFSSSLDQQELFWRIILFVYLQVDLLSVGGLAGKSSVDDLFHQESESERL